MRRRDGQRDGWYGTVGRPAFFALPPEASHRVATSLLSLPLPWERIGGVVDDPSLEVDLCGIRDGDVTFTRITVGTVLRDGSPL